MDTAKRQIGPNMKRVVIAKMISGAIPAGGGLEAGIDFILTPGKMAAGFRSATEWCDAAIAAVRAAGEPNPWKAATEEEIAGELLSRIEERNKARKTANV